MSKETRDTQSEYVVWRNESPSPELRAKVIESVQRSSNPVRRKQWRFAAVALTIAGSISFLILPRKSDAEEAYDRLFSNCLPVDSLHFKVEWRPGNGNVEEGSLRLVKETWWSTGKRRVEVPGEQTSITLGETLYFFDERTKKVGQTVERYPEDFSKFRLDQYIKNYMVTPQSFDWDGNDLVVTGRGNFSRLIFRCRSRKELPYEAIKQYKTSGAWHQSGLLRFEFNQAIDPERFNPQSLIPKP